VDSTAPRRLKVVGFVNMTLKFSGSTEDEYIEGMNDS
jgi:hypothetical protein